MKVPFFPYSKLYSIDKSAYIKIFDDICSRGAFILQQECVELEKKLSDFIGVKHCISVANGTDALQIGLEAVGIGPGDEVIIPSHTYVATAAAIHYSGAVPVLCEIGPDNMMDSSDIEHRITAKTKMIMPVQVNGRCCDMDKIIEICDKHGLLLAEDAAQALGARYNGKHAGTFGSFGTISFYPAKLLGCFGDGGLVFTDDDYIAEKLYLIRDHGRNLEGKVVSWGVNSRLDNLQAGILLHKLQTYMHDIQHRRHLAQTYHEKLRSCVHLELPPAPDADSRHFDVYQNFEIRCSKRDDLKAYLSTHGIGTIIQWAGSPVHSLRELGFDVDLPVTDKFFKKCLMLPINSALTVEECTYICEKIKQFYENA